MWADVFNTFDGLTELPEHIEYIAVGFDAYQNVGHGDELEFGVFRIWKVHFRLPYGLDQIRIVEVQRFGNVRMFQSGVLPFLPEIQVDLVVL